jgi:hypothetical protein
MHLNKELVINIHILMTNVKPAQLTIKELEEAVPPAFYSDTLVK